MSLGSNRDYKTTDRRARTLLALHAKRVNELIASGMDRDQASEQALKDLKKKRVNRNTKVYCYQCGEVIDPTLEHGSLDRGEPSCWRSIGCKLCMECVGRYADHVTMVPGQALNKPGQSADKGI